MHLAYKQVLANKGSAGVDGMQVNELKPIRQLKKGLSHSFLSLPNNSISLQSSQPHITAAIVMAMMSINL